MGNHSSHLPTKTQKSWYLKALINSSSDFESYA